MINMNEHNEGSTILFVGRAKYSDRQVFGQQNSNSTMIKRHPIKANSASTCTVTNTKSIMKRLVYTRKYMLDCSSAVAEARRKKQPKQLTFRLTFKSLQLCRLLFHNMHPIAHSLT